MRIQTDAIHAREEIVPPSTGDGEVDVGNIVLRCEDVVEGDEGTSTLADAGDGTDHVVGFEVAVWGDDNRESASSSLPSLPSFSFSAFSLPLPPSLSVELKEATLTNASSHPPQFQVHTVR